MGTAGVLAPEMPAAAFEIGMTLTKAERATTADVAASRTDIAFTDTHREFRPCEFSNPDNTHRPESLSLGH